MTHHGESLRRLVDDEGLVEQLKENYAEAPLSDADRAMLDYVAKLTATPPQVAEEDLRNLRRTGFSDRAILDVAQIAAYFAFVTRVAEGLGVNLEDCW